METPVLIILVVSCAISFALGRTFVYFRDKKKKQTEETLKALARRRKNRDGGAESKNKAKRKRKQFAKAPERKR